MIRTLGAGGTAPGLLVAAGIVGAVVGVLLPVPVARVTERVPLLRRPFPEVGAALRSVPGWLVVAVTAGGFVATVARFHDQWVVVPYLLLVAALVALSAIDLRTFLLPNRIVYPLAGVSVGALGVTALADGQAGAFGRALLGAVVALGAFAVLHLISPRSLGFGDVKLAFVLGLFLGYLGWGEVLLGLFLGFLYGAVVGVALIVTRVRSRRDHIPFGPFLAAGAMTGIWLGQQILDWYRT